MQVAVMSDLHLEFDDLTLPGGDVLILSGDVCEAKHVNAESYDSNGVTFPFERKGRKPDRYYRFFKEECSKYNKVIYVMGNHEHYGFRFDKTYQYLKNVLPENITLLEREKVEIDNVVFLGATLWTDCNNNDPITMLTLKNYMNDYRVIQNFYSDRNQYFELTPEFTYQVHKLTLAYLKEQLQTLRDKTVVIVTHHSPSRQSTHPRYQKDHYVNGGYSSNLEQFILDHPQIKYWTHGHTHEPFRYQIDQCTIVCNPRGYAGHEERSTQFDPTVGFTL